MFFKHHFLRNDFVFFYLEIMIILSYLAKGIFWLSLIFPSGETKKVGTELGGEIFLFIWFIVEIESSNLWFTIVEY